MTPLNDSVPASIELLGLLAQASLVAFEQTATASATASSTEDQLDLTRIAAQRFSHLDRIETALGQRGSTLPDAMRAFVAPLKDFTSHTRATTWGETLVKLCIVGGLAADFATAVRGNLAPELAEILHGSLDDGDLAERPGELLSRALADDPDQRGRLALYGRRLLGEALSQVQRVAAAHPALTGLVTGVVDDSGNDLAAVSELMADLSGAHARRMESLGLA